MSRFRPNVVIEGTEPWAEDLWTRVTVGEVAFRIPKASGRCVVTTTDQDTARRGREPLHTLGRHRSVGGRLLFGVNLVPLSPAPCASAIRWRSWPDARSDPPGAVPRRGNPCPLRCVGQREGTGGGACRAGGQRSLALAAQPAAPRHRPRGGLAGAHRAPAGHARRAADRRPLRERRPHVAAAVGPRPAAVPAPGHGRGGARAGPGPGGHGPGAGGRSPGQPRPGPLDRPGRHRPAGGRAGAPAGPRPGDTFRIWTDGHGDRVARPLDPGTATAHAVLAGAGAALLAAGLFEGGRRLVLRRMLLRRYACWGREWGRVGPDWGRTGAGS